MKVEDLERIARLALRELGAGDVSLTITATGQPDHWKLHVGGSAPSTLLIRAGSGTTPQFIREQVVTQFVNR
jgi:hypothetical protein